ncbi:MAG: energy coupling factor transporter S component ThiW [Firmicutes bacterium]|nr:energy coupling factor transporter S component ThiW [Bacillota bacterium]
MKVRKLTGMALLVAVGTAGGVLSIPLPLLGAKVAPVQHAINVLAAVMYGPGPAVMIAFLIGLLRNLLATGTILAFPGGMIGAFIAGIAFRAYPKNSAAAVGEVFGTGVLGALAAFPLARFFLGRDVLALTYVVPFALSSFTGAVVGCVVLKLFMAIGQKELQSLKEKSCQ